MSSFTVTRPAGPSILASDVAAPSAGTEGVGGSRTAPTRPRRDVSGQVRLTRRGRWVVTLLLLGAVLALSVVHSSQVVATDDRGVSPATQTVVVGDGESLWSIASRTAAPGETREVMYEIERLNQLETSVLVPGQKLLVPAG